MIPEILWRCPKCGTDYNCEFCTTPMTKEQVKAEFHQKQPRNAFARDSGSTLPSDKEDRA